MSLPNACPRPEKRPKKSPKYLKKSGRIRPNRARQKKAFQEDFGGEEYLAFIHSLPCDVCGHVGHTEAAHLTSRGAGGKAKDLAPLCGSYVIRAPTATLAMPNMGDMLYDGCHKRYDRHDPEIRKHEARLRKTALERWCSHLNTMGK